MRTGLCFGLLLLFAACDVHAIFEEQAGENDWHAEFIGQATATHVLDRDRIAVATASNVIAVLSSTDGDIVWRQVLHSSDQLQHIAVLSKPAAVVSLSSSGTVLRAWQQTDGSLLWEQYLPAQSPSAKLSALSIIPEATAGGGQKVIVTTADGSKVFSGLKGTQLWQTDLTGHWKQVSNPAVSASTDGSGHVVTIAGSLDSGSAEVLKLDLSSGQQLSQAKHRGSIATGLPGSVLINGGLVVAISLDGRSLCTASVTGQRLRAECIADDRSDALSCQLWGSISPAAAGSSEAVFLPLLAESSIAVKLNTGVLLVNMHSGAIKHAAFAKGATAVSSELASGSSKSVAAAGTTQDGGLSFHMLNTASAQIGQHTTVPNLGLLTKDGVAVPLAACFASAGATNAEQPLIGVSAADGTLLTVSGQSVVWRREEALAQVSAAMFLDLPANAESAAQADPSRRKSSFKEHMQAQILNLKEQLSVIQPAEKQELGKLKAALSDRLTPTRDGNGFRKLLVVTSQAGKVFGLHSGDGHVMWSQSYGQNQAPQHIFPWRSLHDVQHAPELLAIHSSHNSNFYSILNAHTGAEVASGKLQHPVSQVLELPQTLQDDVAEQHIYLLIGGKPGAQQVSLLPETSQSKTFLSSLNNDIFFWDVDRTAGTLQGYHVDKQTLSVTKLWSSVHSSPGVGILEVAARNPAEHVYSPAKILGNKSLKIKYLNPSTVFVASGPPEGLLTEDLDPNSLALTVHLVDTVTGAPIYSQTHKGCRGPVHAQFVENWVTYHYWDVSNHRWEMSVLEMYNKAQGNVTITDMILGRSNGTTSSFQPVPLEVLRQSYFFDSGVKALGVSNTMHGISNKLLLVGTLSDQVYMLEKRMLDPRRPVGPPSKDDQLEGLMPYQSSLPISPLMYATHSKQVAQLSGIATAPANLESTSLMLAYGLDLFFSRLQPNKAFDSLQDDFPYAFLVLITMMLLGACLVFKRFDDKATVQRKWV